MLGILIILLFLALGEAVSFLTGRVIPGNIYGMLLLFAALKFNIVKPQWVKTVAHFLTQNMSILFLPAGVGIMSTFGLVKDNLAAIVCATLGSTLLVMGIVGIIVQLRSKK